MNDNFMLTGSICLSDIPKELIRRVRCKDGKERAYLNISIIARREPKTFDNNGRPRTYTHFVSCQPKKEERVEGVNYIFGDLETRTFSPVNVSPSQVAPQAAPQQSEDDDLPF